MRNIVKIKNLAIKKDFKKILTIEEYGLIYYLYLNSDQKDLSIMLNELDLNMNIFKKYLENLYEKKILFINIYVNEYVNTIWEISFNQELKTKSNGYIDYGKLFILNDSQKEILNTITDQKEVFLKLLKIYKSTVDDYDLHSNIVINTEEDYINYLKESKPFNIFYNNQIEPNTKEISLIYELVCLKNFDIPMLNFLIDYVISTSTYNNFSVEYFLKILKNWQKHNIKNLKDAMEFVKKHKNEIKFKGQKYEEPEWDNEEMVMIEEDLSEIEKLLQENEIK